MQKVEEETEHEARAEQEAARDDDHAHEARLAIFLFVG